MRTMVIGDKNIYICIYIMGITYTVEKKNVVIIYSAKEIQY